MVVTGKFTIDGIPFNESEVTGSCSFSPSPITDGTTAITVTYTDGNGVTATASQPITVTHRLVSIAVTTDPTKVEYEYGDTLDTDGMIVTAVYSDGATAAITGSCSPTNLTTIGSQPITVTYSENGITETTTFNVTVNRKTIPVPTWKGALTYNGSAQSADNTAFWNDYTSNVTMGGVRSGTNARQASDNVGYEAEFTPGANYRWPDGTTEAKAVKWFIEKANGSVTVNPTKVDINATNWSTGVAVSISRVGDGAISITNPITSGITATLNGTTITITGQENVPASGTIVVNVAEGTNYKAASVNLPVSAVYFSGSTWLKDSEAAANAEEPASAAEWANFKKWVQGASVSELAACMGKMKKVTLTSTIQGTTTHLVMAVGYNCDRQYNDTIKNTITFHTKNSLATTTVFDSSSASWNGSTVRSLCQNYYNALPFKASVCTVSKGTCTRINSSQSGTPTYQNETVFLPADCEMGFPPGHDYSNGKGYAASYNEFDQQNTSKTAYQYYTTNERRIKKLGDNGSANYYWERSLYYNYADRACYVYSDGKPDGNYYNSSRGFAPAFVI